MISTAASKTSLSFGDAFLKGIACNFLVCIAVWIAGFAARTVGGKVAGLFFPIMIFVVSGFEHSIANMYYISAGLFAKTNDISEKTAKMIIDVNSGRWYHCIQM